MDESTTPESVVTPAPEPRVALDTFANDHLHSFGIELVTVWARGEAAAGRSFDTQSAFHERLHAFAFTPIP